MAQTDTKTPKEIKINAIADTAKGTYSNAIKVSVNDNEVVLDFAFITSDEQGTHGELVSRVIVSQKFIRLLLEVINKTLEDHKQKKQIK